MPQSQELKATFSGGRQNRDNDPRLIKAGDYIRLVNGRIATSEGGDVGAIENVLGNDAQGRLSSVDYAQAFVLGLVRDMLENKIYYFVSGTREDGIYEYDESTRLSRPIVRSTATSGVLKFNPQYLITGANLVGEGDDRLLFWTDNLNQPRRINIERMVTRHGDANGALLDGVREVDGVRTPGFTDEELSVVKEPPLRAPVTNVADRDDINRRLAPLREVLDTDLTAEQRAEIRDLEATLSNENLQDKFIRFAYRWKYVDGEYSVFSPFSDIPFVAGAFRVDLDTGEIISMENLVREISISFNTGPRDVEEIELLYKASNSPTVYVVEAFIKADGNGTGPWGDNVDLSDANTAEKPILFGSNKLYRILPNRELARVFDDVPLKAKAQELVEDRIVYGNYETGY
ncbi:MAG: hypothetical protein K0U41_02160, partial [Gammaproteobacteria bacterium]|nr:hypothetical protein [Gammaproteobacteria bacterium]